MNTQQVVADPLLGLAGVAIAGEVGCDVSISVAGRARTGSSPLQSFLSARQK